VYLALDDVALDSSLHNKELVPSQTGSVACWTVSTLSANSSTEDCCFVMSLVFDDWEICALIAWILATVTSSPLKALVVENSA